MPCSCQTRGYAPPSGPSTAAPVTVAPGTVISALTSEQLTAPVRLWKLTDADEGANLPENPRRCSLWVDNTSSNADAWLVFGLTQNPAFSTGIRRIGPGDSLELYVSADQIGRGQVQVVLDGSASASVNVLEVNYL